VAIPVITTESLVGSYEWVRGRSLEICEPLEIEDYGVQPMDDASPPKWHLAHVTWFFETFLLKPFLQGYRPFDDAFEYLFNSYYNGVGQPYPRARRGHLSRPTVADVKAYREHVDANMVALLARADEEISFRCVLGLNHEQQHQELMLTDLKYNLGHNPLYPAYLESAATPDPDPAPARPLAFTGHAGGVYPLGIPLSTAAANFAFDNESPRHDVLVRDFALADRLVTNAEFLEFVEAGGYEDPMLWLSDGWARLRQAGGRRSPLYWRLEDGAWHEYTLGGLRTLDRDAPVCHVSAYEADAYARWRGCRLPTEAEWEIAASAEAPGGNFVESGRLHPAPAGASRQFFGDCWEWTSSAYAPYPGFRPLAGTLGEYNGKFMANQLVLRGGSCVTPESHMRLTYRNFFYPPDQWQFSGIRLASDPV